MGGEVCERCVVMLGIVLIVGVKQFYRNVMIVRLGVGVLREVGRKRFFHKNIKNRVCIVFGEMKKPI